MVIPVSTASRWREFSLHVLAVSMHLAAGAMNDFLRQG
jgi:hypothetical protein